MNDAPETHGKAAGFKSLIVGIAGGSASGKTTLARELARELESGSPPVTVAVMGMDKFFRKEDPTAPQFEFSLLPGEQTFDFNHPESTDNVALAAEIERLAIADNAPDVMIVEGLMVLALAEIRALCDLRVYVELEDDVRLARRVLRDMNSTRRFTEPREIVQYYLESARVGHAEHVEPSRRLADLIVRGDSEISRAAWLVGGALNALRRHDNCK